VSCNLCHLGTACVSYGNLQPDLARSEERLKRSPRTGPRAGSTAGGTLPHGARQLGWKRLGEQRSAEALSALTDLLAVHAIRDPLKYGKGWIYRPSDRVVSTAPVQLCDTVHCTLYTVHCIVHCTAAWWRLLKSGPLPLRVDEWIGVGGTSAPLSLGRVVLSDAGGVLVET
jgi:hypothetical protein